MQQIVNFLPRELTVVLVIIMVLAVLVTFVGKLPEGNLRTVLEGDQPPCPGGEDASHLALHDDKCSDLSAGDICFEGGTPQGACREHQGNENGLICCQPPEETGSPPEETGQESAQWRPQHDIAADIG